MLKQPKIWIFHMHWARNLHNGLAQANPCRALRTRFDPTAMIWLKIQKIKYFIWLNAVKKSYISSHIYCYIKILNCSCILCVCVCVCI